ncbi:hypothetical protein E2562_003885 [Oryza meyeriana var. granulata]|uniref:Uncharacterized protein n=1 Tax=Oryza meyeriana var. granulata TaxID=110450 RepID=A0A6G1CYW8_9ORYZ|nr:hypothetical protein E2562_003885 [Oryza meyeriana var. granulata]
MRGAGGWERSRSWIWKTRGRGNRIGPLHRRARWTGLGGGGEEEIMAAPRKQTARHSLEEARETDAVNRRDQEQEQE